MLFVSQTHTVNERVSPATVPITSQQPSSEKTRNDGLNPSGPYPSGAEPLKVWSSAGRFDWISSSPGEILHHGNFVSRSPSAPLDSAGRTPSGGRETHRAELPYHPESCLTQGTGRSNSSSSGSSPMGLVIGHSVNVGDGLPTVEVDEVVADDDVEDSSGEPVTLGRTPSEEHAASAATITAASVTRTVILLREDTTLVHHDEMPFSDRRTRGTCPSGIS